MNKLENSGMVSKGKFVCIANNGANPEVSKCTHSIINGAQCNEMPKNRS